MQRKKFILLLFVFSLFFVSSYAQSDTSKDDVVGGWDDGNSWVDASAPVSPFDNYTISISATSKITSTSGLTFSANFTSLSVNGELTINGDVAFGNGTITIGNGGLLVIKGNLQQGVNGSITVQSGGRLVVYGSATVDCNLTVGGQFNVSNDFTYDSGKGRNLTVSATGAIIVGRDLSLGGGTVNLNAGSYIGVLGNASFISNNLPTSAGEVDVIGTASGTNLPTAITETIEAGDPILSVVVGLDAIAFLTGAAIVPNTYNNSSGANYSGEIWRSNNYSTGCYIGVILSGEIVFSDGAVSGQAYFEYSVDGGYTWTTGATAVPSYGGDLYRKDNVPVPSGMIMMRLWANNLPDLGAVAIDKITIAGTNEGGTGTPAIIWDSEPVRDICAGEPAVYEITNFSDYSSIQWNVPDESDVQIVSISNNKARCEVLWNNSPGTLNVTVTGGQCGGVSSSIVYPINVTQPAAFQAFFSKKDISCYNTTPDDGEINLGYCGGSGSDSYLWKSGPGYPFPDNTVSSLTGLSAGVYTATVTRGTDHEDLTITIVKPARVNVSFENTNLFLCAAASTAGAFTIAPSGGTWPYSISVFNGASDITNADNSLVYSVLGVGNYSVQINDKNNCGVRTIPLDIVHDVVPPVFENFPVDAQMTMAAYKASAASMRTTTNLTFATLNASNLTHIPAMPVLNGFHNLTLTFDVSQSPVSTNDGDVFMVEVAYDGSSWIPIYTDNNALGAASVSLPLGVDADSKPALALRFSAAIVTSGLSYSISNVKLSGLKFPEALGGGAPGCTDNSGSCTVTGFVDGAPQWNGCKTYEDGGEFYIVRTWTIADGCSTPASRDQKISVGTPPVFDAAFPADIVSDFCHNASADISVTAPAATEVCGTTTASWVVKKSGVEINGGDAHGTGNLSGYAFPFPANADGVTSEEYVVTWTITDQSFNTVSRDQKITIRPIIGIGSFTIANSDNICKNESVTVTLTPRGGTGNFDGTSFTPAGGVWSSPTYTYITSFAAVATGRTFTIDVTDINGVDGVVGGCSVTLETATFDVHETIGTGAISRD